MDVKGISLRKKRSVARPKIGAPQQITGPVPSFVTKELPHGNSTTSIPLARERSEGGGGGAVGAVTGGAASGDTADYVKRRYSTKVTPQLKDFNINAPAVPTIPSQYTAPAPARKHEEGEKVAVDLDALQDERLSADDCKVEFLLPLRRVGLLIQTFPMCSPRQPRKTSMSTKMNSASSRLGLPSICNTTSSKTAISSSRSVKRRTSLNRRCDLYEVSCRTLQTL